MHDAFASPSFYLQSEFAALLVSMCKHQPELEAYATVFADAERSGAQLPESLLVRLAEVKGRADTAAQEAAAAEAAVQAVQQVWGRGFHVGAVPADAFISDPFSSVDSYWLFGYHAGLYRKTGGSRASEGSCCAGRFEAQGVCCQPGGSRRCFNSHRWPVVFSGSGGGARSGE